MVVRKIGNEYCTVHCTGPEKGEPIACFPTKVAAERQHRAIMYEKTNKIEIDLRGLI